MAFFRRRATKIPPVGAVAENCDASMLTASLAPPGSWSSGLGRAVPIQAGARMTSRTDLPTGTVTFLFGDIEGSTRLLQGLGARYRDVLERHHDVPRNSIGLHKGTVVDTEGDSFFAVFPTARRPRCCHRCSDGPGRMQLARWHLGASAGRDAQNQLLAK